MKKTDQQRKAYHLYFRWVSQSFQEKDIDMEMLVKAKPLSMPVTETMVKEVIWKPILKAMEGRRSTEDMEKMEVSAVYDVMNRWLINEFGIYVPFPSDENFIEKQRR